MNIKSLENIIKKKNSPIVKFYHSKCTSFLSVSSYIINKCHFLVIINVPFTSHDSLIKYPHLNLTLFVGYYFKISDLCASRRLGITNLSRSIGGHYGEGKQRENSGEY